ncbi:hypothetical protein [Mycoplasmopsis columboralis]|uniref:Uncharacterized protein n=1 Tax=Mycoplasmopsis columboralis TaxID=171282 RepID=A0A449B5P6_9BACT|nr:hypothetical protein [Mycoplasmopsis columboralis]VEU75927.1 Uncharacterised protein [Mycoplasmopsis columboralis]
MENNILLNFAKEICSISDNIVIQGSFAIYLNGFLNRKSNDIDVIFSENLPISNRLIIWNKIEKNFAIERVIRNSILMKEIEINYKSFNFRLESVLQKNVPSEFVIYKNGLKFCNTFFCLVSKLCQLGFLLNKINSDSTKDEFQKLNDCLNDIKIIDNDTNLLNDLKKNKKNCLKIFINDSVFKFIFAQYNYSLNLFKPEFFILKLNFSEDQKRLLLKIKDALIKLDILKNLEECQKFIERKEEFKKIFSKINPYILGGKNMLVYFESEENLLKILNYLKIKFEINLCINNVLLIVNRIRNNILELNLVDLIHLIFQENYYDE